MGVAIICIFLNKKPYKLTIEKLCYLHFPIFSYIPLSPIYGIEQYLSIFTLTFRLILTNIFI